MNKKLNVTFAIPITLYWVHLPGKSYKFLSLGKILVPIFLRKLCRDFFSFVCGKE